MCERANVLRLIQRLDQMVKQLDETFELSIHRHVDQSYYMQKIVELTMLLEKLDVVQCQLNQITDWINADYAVVFCRWQADVRWMNQYNLANGHRATGYPLTG